MQDSRPSKHSGTLGLAMAPPGWYKPMYNEIRQRIKSEVGVDLLEKPFSQKNLTTRFDACKVVASTVYRDRTSFYQTYQAELSLWKMYFGPDVPFVGVNPEPTPDPSPEHESEQTARKSETSKKSRKRGPRKSKKISKEEDKERIEERVEEEPPQQGATENESNDEIGKTYEIIDDAPRSEQRRTREKDEKVHLERKKEQRPAVLLVKEEAQGEANLTKGLWRAALLNQTGAGLRTKGLEDKARREIKKETSDHEGAFADYDTKRQEHIELLSDEVEDLGKEAGSQQEPQTAQKLLGTQGVIDLTRSSTEPAPHPAEAHVIPDFALLSQPITDTVVDNRTMKAIRIILDFTGPRADWVPKGGARVINGRFLPRWGMTLTPRELGTTLNGRPARNLEESLALLFRLVVARTDRHAKLAATQRMDHLVIWISLDIYDAELVEAANQFHRLFFPYWKSQRNGLGDNTVMSQPIDVAWKSWVSTQTIEPLILQLMRRRNISPLPVFSLPDPPPFDLYPEYSLVRTIQSDAIAALPSGADDTRHRVPTAVQTTPAPFPFGFNPQEYRHQVYAPSQQDRLITPVPPRYSQFKKRARDIGEPREAKGKRRRGGNMFDELPYR